MKEQHSGIVEWLHSYFSSAILEIRPNLVQDNEQYHTKVLHRSSHLNGGTLGFSPQISDLILRATLYHVILAPHEIAAAFVRVVRFALDLLAHD